MATGLMSQASRIRLRYSKTGKAKYISHLDFMATMRRALKRAGLKLKYSEGFNPHPYMSVALPLSVGCESACELMDIGVTDNALPDDLVDRINTVLPEGLAIDDIYVPGSKFGDIAWIEVTGILYYDKGAPPDIVNLLSECFTEQELIVSKKTKSEVTEINISSYIRDFVSYNDGEIKVSAKVSAQNPSINPESLMDVLRKYHEELMPDFYVFKRINLYDKEINDFK